MAIGDIVAVIDELEFDGADCNDPSIIKINDNIIAVAYQGPGVKGWVKTFSIDADGNLSDTVIDFLEFDAIQALHCEIGHVTGDFYAIVYTAAGTTGTLITVSIDADGNIGGDIIDTWAFSTLQGDHCEIHEIGGGKMAIAYEENAIEGIVFTVEISGAGTISKERIDELKYSDGIAKLNLILHCGGEIYAVAYQGPGIDGWLKTFSIDADGNISDTVTDELEFDTVGANHISACQISAAIYGIAYTDNYSDGWLKTVSIDEDGNISATPEDTWEYDPANASGNDIVRIDDNTVAICYADSALKNQVFTCAVAEDGTITEEKISSQDYDPLSGMNRMIHVKGNIYLIAYSGPDSDGWVKSFNIETPLVPGAAGDLMMMGVG